MDRRSSADVLIVSEADDLHARSVQSEINRLDAECFIVGADETAGHESFNYFISHERQREVRVRTTCGRLVDPADFGSIWWRRYRSQQKIVPPTLEANHGSLLNNDCIATLRGTLETSFEGHWISHPSATDRGSNKIVQLDAADKAGFRIPATLISQSPSAVREFLERYQRVIYKPVAGTPGPLLFTRYLTDELISEELSITSCPTIFQEYIPGELHIRLNCFGARSFASQIESGDLDWRPNLDVPIRPFPVSDRLNNLVLRTLKLLGLEMGIFDIKLMPDGGFVFLEVNPQGQFLFLEAATGEPLARRMAEYLVEEARTWTPGRLNKARMPAHF